MKFCCEELAREVGEHRAFVGGGFLYPGGMQPTGQIEQGDDGTWNVNGCCGGGCYVLTGLKFCPFCGTKLPSNDDQATQGRVATGEEDGEIIRGPDGSNAIPGARIKPKIVE